MFAQIFIPLLGSKAPVYGCTDPAATNYNSSATVNDGSCVYPGGADAYLTAVEATGVTLADGDKTAYTTQKSNLQTLGIWNKIKFYFPFMGATANAHKVEAITATSLITWVGSVLHNASGIKGTGGYGDINLSLASNIGTPQNAHFGFYCRTSLVEVTTSEVDFGVSNDAQSQQTRLSAFSSNLTMGTVGNGFVQAQFGPMSQGTDEILGHIVIVRESSTSLKIYRNGVLIATSTTADTASFLSLHPFVLAMNLNGTPFGTSSKKISALHGGTALNATEVQNLFIEMERLQDGLKRGVV